MIARSLERAHHQVHVISFKRQYPQWLYPGRSDRDPSREPLRVEAQYLLDPLRPWTWWRTARFANGLKPDLAVLQWWTTFWAPSFAVLAYLLRRSGVPVLFLVHNVFPHEKHRWDPLLARLALRQASSHVVQSRKEEARLRSIVPDASAVICPHPAYGMFTSQRVSNLEARKRLALPKDLGVLLFFGIVRPYKGVKDLVQAVALLRDWGKSVYLVVAGEMWEDKASYEQMIEHLNLSELVRLEDRYIPNEEVALFFSAADLFVAPYTGGTQSGVMQIAIAFGLPVVATDIIAAEVTTPIGGYLGRVPPHAPEALAREIQSALEDPTVRQIPLADGSQSALDDWQRLIAILEGAKRASGSA